MAPRIQDHQTIVKTEFVAALEQLLNERPLEKISVKDIAEYSGLSRRSFYNHFKDINDLVAYKHERGGEAVKALCPQWFDSPTALTLSFVYLQENRAFTARPSNTAGRIPCARRSSMKLPGNSSLISTKASLTASWCAPFRCSPAPSCSSPSAT